jgi:hypothetical protein
MYTMTFHTGWFDHENWFIYHITFRCYEPWVVVLTNVVVHDKIWSWILSWRLWWLLYHRLIMVDTFYPIVCSITVALSLIWDYDLNHGWCVRVVPTTVNWALVLMV